MNSDWQGPARRSVMLVAATMAAAAGSLVAPVAAHAERIWDVGDFDNCSAAAENRYGSGQTDSATFADEIEFCCIRSGGDWDDNRGCGAPPARASDVGLPGGMPTVAVDVGSPERPTLPTIAPGPAAPVDSPSPQTPPTTVVRDHRG